MNRRSLIMAAVAVMLTGCGGGGGLGVTGGSIPTGTITGNVVLPSGQPMTSPTVTASVLPSTPVTSVTSTVNPDGTFVVSKVPAAKNIELSFTQSGATLKAIVPSAQVQSNKTVAIGSVTALTTVVAHSIEKETKGKDAATVDLIVAGQADELLKQVKAQNPSQSQQQKDIIDNSELDKSSNKVISGTANSELLDLAATPMHHQADIALDGLVGQIAATGGAALTIAPAQRSSLIQEQLKSTTYTTAEIATALKAAGASSANPPGVAAADAAQRSLLPAWNSIDANITPYEALAIAASPSGASGYALTPAQVAQFLTNLGI